MTELVISEAARADLREIAEYIARDNPARASSFLDELLAKVEDIATRPKSYPVREDWPLPLRSAVHRRYLMVFRLTPSRVEIIRVLHSARNISEILSGD